MINVTMFLKAFCNLRYINLLIYFIFSKYLKKLFCYFNLYQFIRKFKTSFGLNLNLYIYFDFNDKVSRSRVLKSFLFI